MTPDVGHLAIRKSKKAVDRCLRDLNIILKKIFTNLIFLIAFSMMMCDIGLAENIDFTELS